ncbi:Mis18-binding protein 1 [Holothuria leucospilota]|uniref:Mis18-binding protein 1 n=1 Tax=Holothuria leucospilota TaxID=206669 RepID=A0A9Q1CI07_HOLLE|nr:Mis18-binding protein 1 [Holothuria leucospilota]
MEGSIFDAFEVKGLMRSIAMDWLDHKERNKIFEPWRKHSFSQIFILMLMKSPFLCSSRSVDIFDSGQEFENLLRKSPGAKLFFSLPPRKPEAESPLASPLSEHQSKSGRNGPLLSPLAKILKQMSQNSAAGNAVKGNIALNNGLTSPSMPPPRSTFVYRRKGDTPDEPTVKLKRLHHSPLQLPDTPATFSGDAPGGREEELKEDEQEDGNITEEEEITGQEQHSDDVIECETGSGTKMGRMNGEKPKKSLQGVEGKTSEDKEIDTSPEEEQSERTATIHQNGKTYKDTPPNIDLNDAIEETVMDQWYLTQPRKRIIVIEGHRVGDPEDQLWHSSAISKRLSPRHLVTASGSHYRIKGPINIEMTLENGFSAELVKKFLKGFPADWKEIIQEQCLTLEELESQKAESSSDTTAKGKQKHTKGQEAKGAKKKKQDMVEKTTPVTTGKKKSNGTTKQGEPKGQPERKSTPSNAKTQTSSAAFKTPSSATTKFVAVHDLQCSRSGRRILPPLAFWTCERIRPNYRLDKVEIIGGSKDDISNLSNTPKLIGLVPGYESVRTLRPRQKESDNKSSKSLLHKTKGGSVAKQPKKKKKPTKSQRGKIVAKDEKAKSKVADEAEKTEVSVQRNRKRKDDVCDDESQSRVQDKAEKIGGREGRKTKGNREVCDGKGQSKVRDKAEKTGGSVAKNRKGSSVMGGYKEKGQRQVKNNEKQKEKDDGSGKNDDEREALYWSRKSMRRQPRKDINPDTMVNENMHNDFTETNSHDTMNRRVTRSQSLAKNANKRVRGNVSAENDSLPKEAGGRGRKGGKNIGKHQRTVNQPIRNAGMSRQEIVENSEGTQSSDTESAKQEKEMQRTAKQDINKQGIGNASFDLFGDILGILAKQRQKRHKVHSQKMQQSSRNQKTGSEANCSDESDGKENEGDETRAADSQGKVTANLGDIWKGDIIHECEGKATGGTWTIKKKRKNSEKEKSLVGSFQESPEAWSSQDRVQRLGRIEQSAEYDGDVESVTSSNQRRLERRKHSTVLQEENETKEKTVSNTKGGDEKARAGKGDRRKRKAKKVAEKENKDEDAWTQDEIERLQRAMKTIKPSTNNFWEKIAEKVGTRDEEECRIQHQSSVDREEAKTSRDRKPAKVTTKGPITINAKKGTLKRKRQLRELAEHHNMGFEEDLFDATPYRKEKKSRILLCDSSDEENSEAPVPSKTPSLSMPNVVPFSTKKTPHTNWTPGLLQSVNRNKAEEYIYRMQKRKNLAKQKSTPLATRPLAKTGTSKSKFQSRFNEKEVLEAFDVKEVTEEEDSDEEKDYYWSEEEDAVAT